MENQCLSLTVLSAVMGALVDVFGNMGLHGIDSDAAAAVRAVIVA